MNAVIDYVNAFSRALGTPAIRGVLRLDNKHAGMAAFNIAQNRLTTAQIRGAIRNKLNAPWDALVQMHLEALVHRHNNDPATALSIYTPAKKSPPEIVLEVVNEEPRAMWLTSALDQLLNNAQQLAKEADSKTHKIGAQEDNARFVSALLGDVRMPKGGDRPAAAMAHIVVMIAKFKCMYMLNQIQQCVQMVVAMTGAMQQAEQLGVKELPFAYKVTISYFMGRAVLYDDRLTEADEHLSEAFKLCSRALQNNKRAILRYLVPVKMLRWELPSDQLLQQYQLEPYLPIKQSLVAGDVGLLERTLSTHRLQLVQQGTFLMLEKLMWACYRRLLRRVHAYHAQTSDKPHQVPLSLLLGVLQAQEVATDMDQLECVLANLIVRGYVKGYISHASKVIVLAKEAAFPPGSSTNLGELVY